MFNQEFERSRIGLPLFLPTFKSLVAILFLASCNAVVAQSVDVRPVSTLITAARPRRVTAVTETLASGLLVANDIERRAFDQTNVAREQNGLPKLVWDPDLHRMARLHSENMARLGFFSHVTPDGLRLRDRVRAVGIQCFDLLGENIASNLGYDDPGGFAVERWLTSPAHRANVLSAGFKAMAVGTFVAADGSVFLTQVFISR
jgi:uncharacterized protein YkwD